MNSKKKKKNLNSPYGSTLNYFFDNYFSSTTKQKEKKYLFTGISRISNSIVVGKAKYFFHAGARSVPPKVSRVLSPLPSSSLHPPVESLMRARQPLQAAQAAVPLPLSLGDSAAGSCARVLDQGLPGHLQGLCQLL